MERTGKGDFGIGSRKGFGIPVSVSVVDVLGRARSYWWFDLGWFGDSSSEELAPFVDGTEFSWDLRGLDDLSKGRMLRGSVMACFYSLV